MGSTSRDDVMLTIGRELSHALDGQADIRLREKELLLDEGIETRLYLRTSGTIDGFLMSVLAERGYELLHVPEELLDEDVFPHSQNDLVWHVQIPEVVHELFEKYVTVRGGAHPAPPKKRGEPIRYDGNVIHRSKWSRMEWLPHPVVDGMDAFNEKLNELRSD